MTFYINLFLIFYIFLSSCNKIEYADSIYFNANIYTGVEDDNSFTSIGIKDQKIFFLGNENFQKIIGEHTEVLDVNGLLLMPGLIDNHTHFMYGASQMTNINLKNVNSKFDFINKVKSHAQNLNPGDWILGGDWNHENWGGELPHKNWIDSVTHNNPLLIHRLDGHMALTNDYAIKLSKINLKSSNPEGGIILVKNDEITGILKDEAINLIKTIIPEKNDKEREKSLLRAQILANSYGITQIHDMCDFNDLKFYIKNKDKLTLRIKAYTWYSEYKDLIGLIKTNGIGDDLLSWNGIKAMVDGSLGSRTAWLHENYLDDKNTNGLVVLKDTSNFSKILDTLDRENIQIAVHAIGDKANDWIINKYIKLINDNGKKDRRLRIEHSQHLSNQALQDMAKYEIIASMQPYGAIDDSPWMHKRISDELMKNSYIFKKLINNNVIVTFGSDWTVTPLNPFQGIYAACTRLPVDNKYPNGWYPDEIIDIHEAVKCYTSNNAFASFMNKKTGTLEIGKYADFIILSSNLFTVNKSDIKDIIVQRTIVSGKEVYIK